MKYLASSDFQRQKAEPEEMGMGDTVSWDRVPVCDDEKALEKEQSGGSGTQCT